MTVIKKSNKSEVIDNQIASSVVNRLEEEVYPLKEPESVPVFFEWNSCATDPTSYKQLSPVFHPLNVKIRVDVPKKYVLSYNVEDGTSVLTPEGAAFAMRKIAISIINIQTKE